MTTLIVIGTGYLGTTHAACLADLGFQVNGVDTDPDKVATLASRRIPCYEPDLEPLVRKHVEHGRLRFSTDIAIAAEHADVHFLCVGTPQRSDGLAADLTAVEGAVAALAPQLRRGCLVVGKSTVPVGTATRLAATLRTLAPAGEAVHLAWNPEFLREGHAVEDTLRPNRLVFGVEDDGDLEVLREVYRDLLVAGIPEVVADLASAELVKTAANSFLATKISFINAMAEICEAAGADVGVLAEALALDPRIGGQFLKPGLGFGGGCLPKDIRAFVSRAEEIGAGRAVGFLHEVDQINLRNRQRVVELAIEELGGAVAGKVIAVLGAAFKPGSDDVRDSPALHVAAQLHRGGATVRVHDPKAMRGAAIAFPELIYARSVPDACADADLLVLATEWPEFVMLDPAYLSAITAGHTVIDARNALDPARWRGAGWRYLSMGRPRG